MIKQCGECGLYAGAHMAGCSMFVGRVTFAPSRESVSDFRYPPMSTQDIIDRLTALERAVEELKRREQEAADDEV